MLAARAAQAVEIKRKVVLAGNPNAGKTTLFNALTKSSLKTGNWHGVTTSTAEKTVGDTVFADCPGMYSFDAYSMEETSAAESVKSADIIINVIDSLTLENSLRLTERLLALNGNVVVYLTKCDRLRARGGKADKEALQKYLGVPVYDCPPKTLKKLIDDNRLLFAVNKEKIPLDKAYYRGNCDLNLVEKLFYNKFFALAAFVLTMVSAFFITFHPSMPGAYFKGLLEELICDKAAGALASVIASAPLSSFVCEGIIGGVGGVLSFIPQLAVLYLFLILLDESGVMSALSFVTDGLFEKVKLSGRAAFSLLSGFGCTAAAISTTRGFTTVSAQERTVRILPFVPCGAKLPVFLTFISPLFSDPFPIVCILYFSGLALSVLLSAVMRGGGEGMISEIAPISAPRFSAVKNKLFFQIKGFIIKVTLYVFAFCVISWILSHFTFSFQYAEVEGSMLCSLSRLVAPLFYPMGVTDWRLAYAAISGFAAKENVAATVGLLMPEGLNLALAPSLAFCTFMLCCPACISAFAASVKEIGLKKTAVNNLFQLVFAFLAAYLINFIFSFI